MTTIIGYKSWNGVYLASDTRLSSNGRVFSDNTQKIFETPKFSVAVSGCAAVLSAMPSILDAFVESNPDSITSTRDAYYLASEIYQSLVRDHFMVQNEELEFGKAPYHLLIATPTALFASYSFRETIEVDDYVALGSGGDIALGAIHALTSYNPKMEPQNVIRTALSIASQHDNGTGKCTKILILDEAWLERN